jgi:hypothetical protein
MNEDLEQLPQAGVRSRDFIGDILRINRLWTVHGKAAPGSLTPCHSHATLTSALNTCHRFRAPSRARPGTAATSSLDKGLAACPARTALGRHKDLRVELDSQQVPLHPEVLLCHPCTLQLFPTTQAPTSDIELGASARTLLWLRVRRSVSAVSWPANHGRASVFRYQGQKPWQGLRGPRR